MGVPGSCGNSILNLLRSHLTIFRSGCALFLTVETVLDHFSLSIRHGGPCLEPSTVVRCEDRGTLGGRCFCPDLSIHPLKMSVKHIPFIQVIPLLGCFLGRSRTIQDDIRDVVSAGRRGRKEPTFPPPTDGSGKRGPSTREVRQVCTTGSEMRLSQKRRVKEK